MIKLFNSWLFFFVITDFDPISEFFYNICFLKIKKNYDNEIFKLYFWRTHRTLILELKCLLERFDVAREVTVNAKNTLVFKNMFSTGNTIGDCVLASLAVQIIGRNEVVAERTGSLFYFCLSSHRSPRYLLDSRLVLLSYLLSVLRTNQHTCPIVSYFF
jgi:hypothetical protein